MNVVFDLDRTLANDSHRAGLLDGISMRPEEDQKPIWAAYFDECTHDSPISINIDLFKMIRDAGHRCEIWTGRPKRVELQTRTWLSMYGIRMAADQLRMRDNEDFRSDYMIKEEWLNKAIDNKFPVDLAFDDRDQVVKMWRSRGIRCLQVADGTY